VSQSVRQAELLLKHGARNDKVVVRAHTVSMTMEAAIQRAVSASVGSKTPQVLFEALLPENMADSIDFRILVAKAALQPFSPAMGSNLNPLAYPADPMVHSLNPPLAISLVQRCNAMKDLLLLAAATSPQVPAPPPPPTSPPPSMQISNPRS
jgi:hypothetical protein